MWFGLKYIWQKNWVHLNNRDQNNEKGPFLGPLAQGAQSTSEVVQTFQNIFKTSWDKWSDKMAQLYEQIGS